MNPCVPNRRHHSPHGPEQHRTLRSNEKRGRTQCDKLGSACDGRDDGPEDPLHECLREGEGEDFGGAQKSRGGLVGTMEGVGVDVQDDVERWGSEDQLRYRASDLRGDNCGRSAHHRKPIRPVDQCQYAIVDLLVDLDKRGDEGDAGVEDTDNWEVEVEEDSVRQNEDDRILEAAKGLRGGEECVEEDGEACNATGHAGHHARG